MRSVTVMRKSSDQSPDNGGRGCRRDQMFQGVSGDETESVRDLVVVPLTVDSVYAHAERTGAEPDSTETVDTGPTTSWREETKIAYTTSAIGTA